MNSRRDSIIAELMNNEEEIEIALCWFDEEQWSLLSEIDPNGVDSSYEEWRRNASKAFSEFMASGQKVRKVSIKISVKTSEFGKVRNEEQLWIKCIYFKGMWILVPVGFGFCGSGFCGSESGLG